MILIGDWRPEQRLDSVAHLLVDRALIAIDGFHHPLKDGIEQPACILGIAIGDIFGRSLHVREKHCDLFSLPFQRGIGAEDRLGGRGCG